MTDNYSTAPLKNKRRPQARRAFLSAYLRAPRNVGAVIPSGKFLCRKIAQQVDTHHPGWVIELGAGTGVVTRALLDAGIPPERLLVVERDRRLFAHLKERFAAENPRIVRADAASLKELLEQEKINKVNSVVSSLPMLSLPLQVQENVVKQVFEVMPEKGKLVQFTYGAASPIKRRILKHNSAEGEKVATVLLNLPPAHVWCYRQRGQA